MAPLGGVAELNSRDGLRLMAKDTAKSCISVPPAMPQNYVSMSRPRPRSGRTICWAGDWLSHRGR